MYKTVIEQRIATYPAGTLKFNLYSRLYERALGRKLGARRAAKYREGEASTMSGESMLRRCPAVSCCADTDPQFENSLRRHNHLGLAHAALLTLVRAGQVCFLAR
jgi:ubiquitin carboxyl-terminal hydrolase L5